MRRAALALAILLALAPRARAADEAAVRTFCSANAERLAASTPREYARRLAAEGREDFLPNATIRLHADGKIETFGRDRWVRETAREIAALRTYEERIERLEVLSDKDGAVCVADVAQRGTLARGGEAVHVRGRLQTRAWVVEREGRLRVARLEAYQTEKKSAAAAEKGA